MDDRIYAVKGKRYPAILRHCSFSNQCPGGGFLYKNDKDADSFN